MAKARPAQTKQDVTLEAPPWETHFEYEGAHIRGPRRDLQFASIVVGKIRTASGGLVERRARVWRVSPSPLMRVVPPVGRAAFLDYAEAVECVASSGGTSDPTGGGGGCAGSRMPGLAKMDAAGKLRSFHAALEGRDMVLLVNPNESPRRHRHVRCSYADLAQWVAIDALALHEVLKRLGISARNQQARDACTLAVVDLAHVLAVCCGYMSPARAEAEKRNTLRGGV